MPATTRPFVRLSHQHQPRALPRGSGSGMSVMPNIQLPPSNGQREPGTNYASHVTAEAPLLMLPSMVGGRYYPGSAVVFYQPTVMGGPGQFTIPPG